MHVVLNTFAALLFNSYFLVRNGQGIEFRFFIKMPANGSSILTSLFFHPFISFLTPLISILTPSSINFVLILGKILVVIRKKWTFAKQKVSFSDVECTFNVAEPAFNVAECRFNVVERNFYLGINTFILRYENYYNEEQSSLLLTVMAISIRSDNNLIARCS